MAENFPLKSCLLDVPLEGQKMQFDQQEGHWVIHSYPYSQEATKYTDQLETT